MTKTLSVTQTIEKLKQVVSSIKNEMYYVLGAGKQIKMQKLKK